MRNNFNCQTFHFLSIARLDSGRTCCRGSLGLWGCASWPMSQWTEESFSVGKTEGGERSRGWPFWDGPYMDTGLLEDSALAGTYGSHGVYKNTSLQDTAQQAFLDTCCVCGGGNGHILACCHFIWICRLKPEARIIFTLRNTKVRFTEVQKQPTFTQLGTRPELLFLCKLSRSALGTSRSSLNRILLLTANVIRGEHLLGLESSVKCWNW